MRVIKVCGTLPEAIKMALVHAALKDLPSIDVKFRPTGQHRQMLDQVPGPADIPPHYDLDHTTKGQEVIGITCVTFIGPQAIYPQWQPDLVFLRADTDRALVGSLSAWYAKMKLVHVEAGLRVGNKCSSWSEEMNRQITGFIAAIHFAIIENVRANQLAGGSRRAFT